MKLRFWGVRGSIATPGRVTSHIGGNTSCIEVVSAKGHLILDAGTGLRALGKSLMRRRSGRQEYHILLSHYHIDHIYGLPFFSPLYARHGHKIHIYGPAGYKRNLKAILDSLFAQELFPVSLRQVPARLFFHSLGNRNLKLDGLKITSFFINHPGRAVGYLIDDGAARVAYLSDHEPVSSFRHPSLKKDHSYEKKLLAALRGVDLLIHDAHFSDAEYPHYRGWGHSPWSYAVELATAANVRQLALFHHSPDHDDREIERAFERLKSTRAGKSPKLLLPREGSTHVL